MFKYYLEMKDRRCGDTVYCSHNLFGTIHKCFSHNPFNEKGIIFFDTEEEAQAEKLKISKDKKILKSIHIIKICDLFIMKNNL